MADGGLACVRFEKLFRVQLSCGKQVNQLKEEIFGEAKSEIRKS